MKQSDMVTVAMVAIIGTIVAFVLVNSFLGEPKDVTYKTVSSVTADLAIPDSEVFNDDAVNPTVEAYVGNDDKCSKADKDGDGVVSEQEREECENEENPGENPGENPDPNPTEE